jgi:membrane protein DedA with SNARE-associated domain
MVESFLTPFLNYIESAFGPGNISGLIVLALLAAITDIGVPVPFFLDTVLMLAAYHAGVNYAPVFFIVLALFIGRQAGSGALYLVSRFLGKGFINWLKRRFPSIGNRLDSAKLGKSRWTPLAVVTGRLTPGLLQITTVASGSICLRYDYFALAVATSSLIYDFILILLGFIAAHSPLADNINLTSWLLIALIVIVCILWPLLFIFLHRSSKKPTGPLNARN